MSNAIHVIRLRCLWARIHTSLYSDTASCNPDHPTYSIRVDQLRVELDDWLASAPPIRPRQGIALSIFATRDWVELNYSYCILLIYRGQLIKYKGVANAVLMECLRAAKGICHGYRHQYIGKPVNFTWGALHCLFTAGLTYLHCIWTILPAVRDTVRYNEISNTCTDCTMVLVVMAERWKDVAPYRDMFEALASRTMAMVVGNGHEQWTLPVPSTPTLTLDPDDLARWTAAIADSGMSDGIDELLSGLMGCETSPEETSI